MSVDKTQQSREQTRAELAETLDALARKADVKSRTKARAQQTWAGTRDRVDPTVAGAAGAAVVVAVVAGLLAWRHWR